MSYLSSNRKERFPIEKSGNGNARQMRSRLVVSADNRRATAAQRAADTAPSRRTLLARGKRHRTETTPPPNRLRRTKRLPTRSRWCRRGTSGGKKNPPILPASATTCARQTPDKTRPNVRNSLRDRRPMQRRTQQLAEQSDPNKQTTNQPPTCRKDFDRRATKRIDGKALLRR